MKPQQKEINVQNTLPIYYHYSKKNFVLLFSHLLEYDKFSVTRITYR
jgi:hypothetical protein